MCDTCDDNRFELIKKYKQKLLDATNIEDSPEEMAVIDNILFRFWQMGWLDRLELFGNSEQLDNISRAEAINAICEDGTQLERQGQYTMTMAERKQRDADILDALPSAQPVAKDINVPVRDCISRQAALDVLAEWNDEAITNRLNNLPSAQPPKEIPKRVLWSGWKGCRDTRYKCPNCEKPVRNDDAYCHRCGQRLMFPHISFTDYVPGEKQDVIVRWDDEG